MTLPWTTEREETWTAAWWREDFSWTGLASKRGGPEGATYAPSTLQDYWRLNPADGSMPDDEELKRRGILIDAADGRRWHIAHYPLRLQDGAAAKSTFTVERRLKLADMLLARIAVAERPGDNGSAAMFAGVVGLDLEPTRPLALAHPLDAPRSRWGNLRIAGRLQTIDLSLANVDHLSLSGVEIMGTARLRELRSASDVNMNACRFRAGLDLTRAVIGGFAELREAWINGPLLMDSGYIHRNLRLHGFQGFAPVDLNYINVLGNTWLSESDGSKAAVFHRGFKASSANFGGFQARKATFHGRMDFRQCVFAEDASFECARLPDSFGEHDRAFDLATFVKQADLRGVSLDKLAAFAGAQFRQSVLADQPSPAAAEVGFQSAMRRAAEQKEAGEAAQSVERGARAFKNAMEGVRDRMREQHYYRYEIRARARRSDTGIASRGLTWLYVKTSDCGLSARRPLLVLSFLTFAMAAIYLALAVHHRVAGGAASQLPTAIGFSLSRALPFTIWEKTASDTPLGELLSGPWTGVVVRALAVMQSVLSAILLFLSGLAARRHFQIQ